MSGEFETRLIYDLTMDELEGVMSRLNEPKFRAAQIWDGLYKNLWREPSQFTNLSKSLRGKLKDEFDFGNLTLDKELSSKDKETTKVLFRTRDGRGLETVLMRYDRRRTLCISSQSGCAMGCTFCATGQMGLGRNLSSGEIVEQVLHYARVLQAENEKVTNIVLMGMGEPFHNYAATMAAIDRLNDKRGFNLGARRFTVSTVGLIPGIQQFAEENRQVNLAVSLHAVDDDLRSSMIPINDKYPVRDLLEACRDYTRKTRRRITFEWALIEGINDSIQQANDFADLIQGMPSHVNLIPLNPTKGFTGERSSRERVKVFQDTLTQRGIPCTVRVRRGIDIYAGCGQLAS